MANDGGIHFPPKQRRDKPLFEPPPWERDQFKQREIREGLGPELVQKTADAVATEKSVGTGTPAGFSQALQQETPIAPNSESEQVVVEAEKPELDPRHLELLMMGLRSEEPQAREMYWKASVLSGVVMTLVGLVMAVWGLIALVSTKRGSTAPVLIAAALLVFGIGFLAAGFWVVFRTLRQQGVL